MVQGRVKRAVAWAVALGAILLGVFGMIAGTADWSPAKKVMFSCVVALLFPLAYAVEKRLKLLPYICPECNCVVTNVHLKKWLGVKVCPAGHRVYKAVWRMAAFVEGLCEALVLTFFVMAAMALTQPRLVGLAALIAIAAWALHDLARARKLSTRGGAGAVLAPSMRAHAIGRLALLVTLVVVILSPWARAPHGTPGG